MAESQAPSDAHGSTGAAGYVYETSPADPASIDDQMTRAIESPNETTTQQAGSLLDLVLNQVSETIKHQRRTGEKSDASSSANAQYEPPRRIARFIESDDRSEQLQLYWGASIQEPADLDRDLLRLRLDRDIAQLDELISEQLDEILHHPTFQEIESAWRGLKQLVDDTPIAPSPERQVKIRVLSASLKDVARDLGTAADFDQSTLFRRIYTDEFDQPGGEPYGMLIGNYNFGLGHTQNYLRDDIDVLSKMSGIAACAFAPFISGVAPTLMGLDSFTQFDRRINLESTFSRDEYIKWNALRDHPDSRFLGACLPRVLRRLPYDDDINRVDGFCYREDVSGRDASKYLWGNSAFAFASVVIRSFAETGWFTSIRGAYKWDEGEDGEYAGGIVPGLPVDPFHTDQHGIAMKSSVEVYSGDEMERDLAEQGLMTLCHCKDTPLLAFYGNPSMHRPGRFQSQDITANDRLASMLQYVLCASRFAHLLKIMNRENVGRFADEVQLENELDQWIKKYVASSATQNTKDAHPLSDAEVKIEATDQPGAYRCRMDLKPHDQLDGIFARVQMTTDLTTGKSS